MAEVKVYENPNHFWDDVSPHLKKEEAKNSLCLGLSYRFRSYPDDCIYQSAIFENDEFLGSLVLSKYRTNYNLLPTPTRSEQAAQKLFSKFLQSQNPVTGIVGEKNTAYLYGELLNNESKKTKVHMEQGIYKCTKVIMPNLSSDVAFRIANESDIQQIANWINEFHHEAVPHDPPVDGEEVAKSKIDAGMVYITEANQKPVSMAAWSRDIETSCSVNMVYTPKNLRKKGYGSLVTAQLTQSLLGRGKKETNLYTDMSNPTSNKIYMDIGYELVCNSVHLGVF